MTIEPESTSLVINNLGENNLGENNLGEDNAVENNIGEDNMEDVKLPSNYNKLITSILCIMLYLVLASVPSFIVVYVVILTLQYLI